MLHSVYVLKCFLLPVQQRIHLHLYLIMDYGLTHHLIDQNPERLLKPKDFAATASKPRDRVLSLYELRRL